MNLRWATWLSTCLLFISLCLLYGLITKEFNSLGTIRAIVSFFIAALGILSVFIFPDTSKKTAIILILGLSLASRIALLPTAPSDDVNRYLWEGKLYSLHVSPYASVAFDERYTEYRDQYWEKMNHRDRITAYPPLSQHIFKWINKLGYNPMSYKVVFLLIDILLIATILALLHQHHRPLHWALLYALSPISLLSFAAEGHFDIVMVFSLTFSLYALSRRWFIICGIAVGVAISTKIMAIVAAPLILWKTGIKGISVAIITAILPFALHYEDTLQMMHGLISFGSEFRFNGPVHQLISLVTDLDYKLANQVNKGLFIITWFMGFILMLKRQLWSGLLVSFGALIIFSPIIHFWYLSWIMPLIALRPRLSWVSLSFSMSLYFLVHDQKVWGLPAWAEILFWLPFFLFLIGEQKHFFSRAKRIIKTSSQVSTDQESISLSVIIPTYNPGDKLSDTLKSIDNQSTPPDEIIIVDAGSSDGALEKIKSPGIKLLQSPLGRGAQIKQGVISAKSTWSIILHADNALPPHALETLKKAILTNSNLIGGSLGQRFDKASLKLLLIESMNEFRATLLHTSFGDQNQFLHTQTAIENDILTDQPLMEDVEMSDRLYALGETLHLAYESRVSAQKWGTRHFWKRFSTIISFCIKYRLLFFSKTKRSQLSALFYKKYYG